MEIQIFMSGKNMSLNISKDSLVSQMPRNSKEKKNDPLLRVHYKSHMAIGNLYVNEIN